MADILRELKESARRRRGSISTTRAAEARQEEEGGSSTTTTVKLVEETPQMKLLKRCYVIGTAVIKIGFAAAIFVILMNLMASMAFKTVTSERLGLFTPSDQKKLNRSNASMNSSLTNSSHTNNTNRSLTNNTNRSLTNNSSMLRSSNVTNLNITNATQPSQSSNVTNNSSVKNDSSKG